MDFLHEVLNFLNTNAGWIIGATSVFYVYKQVSIQTADHKTGIFVNAIDFIDHDITNGVSRDKLHCGLSIFKSITKSEDLRKVRNKEFLYSVTVTRFLTEHIKRIETDKMWREFYKHNLRDFYEIGYLIRLMMNTLPSAQYPLFYCFKDFYVTYQSIFKRYFFEELMDGKELFEELIDVMELQTRNVLHVKGFSDDDFVLKNEK